MCQSSLRNEKRFFWVSSLQAHIEAMTCRTQEQRNTHPIHNSQDTQNSTKKNHRKVRNIAICGVFCTCMAHPQSQNGKWVNTCKHHVLFILRQTIFSATPTHLTPKFALKRNFIPSQGPFTKPWISPIRGTSKFHHPRQASRGITLSGPTHTPSPTLRKKS